ncbi:helix-turn-helix domain-containing protein [Alkalihalobacillus sp. CinArs1]|uniref:helix-turn-helix domain-containing protein n=1 Tax=Alkalihalobacillus sp. CinArs1 TaxID=2995314 RepID=UPI0022DD15A6|nr:helix-turn-helix domain-containing protein [Alkalihalobacillus sp. CinArs1]
MNEKEVTNVGYGAMELNYGRITLTAKEAAEYLGVSYWLILEMAKRKEIPHVRAGKRVLFRKESLLAWVRDREATGSQTEEIDSAKGSLRKLQP